MQSARHRAYTGMSVFIMTSRRFAWTYSGVDAFYTAAILTRSHWALLRSLVSHCSGWPTLYLVLLLRLEDTMKDSSYFTHFLSNCPSSLEFSQKGFPAGMTT